MARNVLTGEVTYFLANRVPGERNPVTGQRRNLFERHPNSHRASSQTPGDGSSRASGYLERVLQLHRSSGEDPKHGLEVDRDKAAWLHLCTYS